MLQGSVLFNLVYKYSVDPNNEKMRHYLDEKSCRKHTFTSESVLCKALKRRTLHVPSLIPIWVDPNNSVRQLIQTSTLILSNLLQQEDLSILKPHFQKPDEAGLERNRFLIPLPMCGSYLCESDILLRSQRY